MGEEDDAIDSTEETTKENEITKEEFLDWKRHPVTKFIFAELKSQQEAREEALAKGKLIDMTNISVTVQATNQSIGYCNAVDDLLNIEYE